MKLVWSGMARQDRRDIRHYIAQDSPRAAVALDRLISDKVMALIETPDMGRLGRVQGTRELVVHPNYVIVYDADGVSIRILRLLHAAMPWP